MSNETQDPKVAKKQAKEARKKARNEAFAILKELVDGQKDPKFKEALSTVRPSIYGIQRVGGGGGSSIATKFMQMMNEKTQVAEDVVFKELKIGRKECASIIRKTLRKSEKEARVWINFDPKTGIYKIVGRGPKAPDNYTGYVPIEENTKLK